MALPLSHATPLCLHPNDGVPLGNCGSGHSSNINSFDYVFACLCGLLFPKMLGKNYLLFRFSS